MAVPSTPTNFYLQAGDNYSYLSWDAVSGAVTYKVQRSRSGATYSTIATPIVTNYSDTSILDPLVVNSTVLVVSFRYKIVTLGTTTEAEWHTLGVPASVTPEVGVVFTALVTGTGAGSGTVSSINDIFYYKIAATNGDGDSAFTEIQSVIPVAMGKACLGNIRLQAQQRADRVNSNFVTLPEWNQMISLSAKELYDLLIQEYGEDYKIAVPYSYTTSGTIDPNWNAQVYPLPDDFYKLILCEVALNPGDPNSWVTLKQYNRIQQNLWNYPNVYTFYGITNLRYRLTADQLQIVPICSANQTIRIWYVPRPPKLVADTDVIDGISGYEEYVIVSAAIKALVKEESQCPELMAELQMMEKRIIEMARNRNIAEPQTVSDSRIRNLSWSDDGSWSGGGTY